MDSPSTIRKPKQATKITCFTDDFVSNAKMDFVFA